MTVEEWLGEDNLLGCDIWHKKYQFNNENFEEWLDRISGGDKELRQLIKEKKFLFGGRTLANRNTGKKGSMMNCYSRGFCGDSLAEIMQANTDLALTFKAQGGQGISLSQLRPKGTGINNGQFQSDGIVPFMEIFNRTTESVSQGGSRKGALLMSLDIWHKEAEDFIKIKSEEGKIQKANLSLEIDDEFMEAVKEYYKTGTIVTKTINKNYNGNEITYEVTPIKLYKLMMEKAWDWGEPGCIFTNKFRNYNLMQLRQDYQIENCNPCGEQPLPKHGACNLGSLNLSEFVLNPFTNKAEFNYSDFKKAIIIAVRSLDKIIDENKGNHALKEQQEMSLNYRNIGLGIMGLHDCLLKMGLRYGSKESITITNNISNFLFKEAVKASSLLAKQLGVFPKYDKTVLSSDIIKNHFFNNELDDYEISLYGLRNCSLISIAPSGSIGTMLNISTGCEPLFMVSYNRKTESLNGQQEKTYTVYTKVAKDYLTATGKITLPSYFITAHDVPWQERIEMQSVLQRHVDTAISSTINLPKDTPLEEVEQLYLQAWEKGLKGVTIFRDGCKRMGILTNDSKKPQDESKMKQIDTKPTSVVIDNPEYKATLPRGVIIKADDNSIGKKRTLHTGCGTLHIEAFFDPADGSLLETYFSKGSTGGCNNFMIGLSRMISLSARGGVDIYSIVDQLKSSGACPSYAVRTALHHDTSKGSCCPVAIGNALIQMYEEMQEEINDGEISFEPIKQDIKTSKQYIENQPVTNKCPTCGAELSFTGGCYQCFQCGYSKCE